MVYEKETDSPLSISEARKRHLRRQQRNRYPQPPVTRPALPFVRASKARFLDRLLLIARLFPSLPMRLHPLWRRIASAIFVLAPVLFVSLTLLRGAIFPNVWSLGVDLGSLTVQEAANALSRAWVNTVTIRLADGDREWTARPMELGLELDAEETAVRARGAGLAGLPLGFSVTPVVYVNEETATLFLNDLAADIEVAPVNAGYEWRDDQLFGVRGRDGRRLDIPATLNQMVNLLDAFVEQRQLELTVLAVSPEVIDPAIFHDQAHLLVTRPFELRGYDPFHDEALTWTPSRTELASWLEARTGGLTLRPGALDPFIAARNRLLDDGTMARYVDSEEAAAAARTAVEAVDSVVSLRLRHQPTIYTVVTGDSGYRIARKIGVPYYLLEQANPGRDLSILAPGDTVNSPSPDVMVPLPPIASKRIVVDLDRQYLIAYEDGEERFNWPISSGIAEAPTSPGIYQILSHVDVAYGSSYSLCDDTGCGQWELNWFMGIYEVVPGLVNGFHGAVLLPNGTYLGGGNVGAPYTLGCVMSRDEDARRLYEWADEGTIVEIISGEYQPRSALGQRAAIDIATRL